MLLAERGTHKTGGTKLPRLLLFGMLSLCCLALCPAGPRLANAQVSSENQAVSGQEPAQPAQAVKEVQVEDILRQLLPDGEKEGFVYRTEGRPDPFLPFITEQRLQAEQESEEKLLAGMQLFEPGQLTLVGIVNTEREAMAMVQDSSGKGYVVRRGTKLGRHGVVVDIAANEVSIRELLSVNSMANKKTYKTTKMVLKKKEGVNE